MLLKIGTRGSQLALAQSQWVKAQVEARHPHVSVALVRIKTKGDKILDSPLSQIGGKGLFVKEIEDALMRKEVDLAVHSMKDVPTDLPDGLHLAVFPERENPWDAFVSVSFDRVEDLPQGARVGTSSLRRSAQLLQMRPDLEVVPLRGNVDTRLRKLEAGEVQGILLAAAGLKRLGLAGRISHLFSADRIIPAIGQGALGLELRLGDEAVLEQLRFLNDERTELTVRAERAFLKELEGGCQVPIAAHAALEDGEIMLQGMVAELDGSRVIRDRIRGERESPDEIGKELAKRLLDAGAGEILVRIYGRSP
jgi:hydroxymethylbilane synthase